MLSRKLNARLELHKQLKDENENKNGGGGGDGSGEGDGAMMSLGDKIKAKHAANMEQLKVENDATHAAMATGMLMQVAGQAHHAVRVSMGEAEGEAKDEAEGAAEEAMEEALGGARARRCGVCVCVCVREREFCVRASGAGLHLLRAWPSSQPAPPPPPP